MVTKKAAKKEMSLPKWFWITIFATAVVVIVTVGWLLLAKTGWPGYIQALSECGGKPPVQAKSFLVDEYRLPGDEKYRIPGEGYRTYFCSEAEAQREGYEHSKS